MYSKLSEPALILVCTGRCTVLLDDLLSEHKEDESYITLDCCSVFSVILNVTILLLLVSLIKMTRRLVLKKKTVFLRGRVR